MDPYLGGGGLDPYLGGGGLDPYLGGGGLDPYVGGGGAGYGGGGGAGGTQKQMIKLGLTTASLSLGFLVVVTIAIAFSSKGEGCTMDAKQTPVLMALFVGALAAGTWKLRNHLVQGFTILDSLPPFFTGGGGLGDGKPVKPPQLGQWENWTMSWLLCFCLVVWGGIFLLETYSVEPLGKLCPVGAVGADGEPAKGVIPALLQMRRIVYGLLILLTFVPLYMAWSQRKRWGRRYHAALNRYNQRIFGDPAAAAQEAATAQTTPAYDPKSPENLSPQEGGYSPQTGSTRLFDATYAMAELVGYASPNAYGSAPAAHSAVAYVE
jgi:hypothetical protein